VSFGFDRYSYLAEMRLSFGMPRRVVKPKADLHERMEAHWSQHARALGRPDYHEARGFAASSTAGREQPYGPFSGAHWKYIRWAMREAFLAEWHRALGTTYETAEGGRRAFAVLTGIMS
jgi:hypothetical protein